MSCHQTQADWSLADQICFAGRVGVADCWAFPEHANASPRLEHVIDIEFKYEKPLQ